MALATFHFSNPITSVTFNGKTATSSPTSISYSATASISEITVTSGWSGTIYWDTTSAMSDPYQLATVSNGRVTMTTAKLTYTGSNRDVYLSASGGGGTTPKLTIGGTWPSQVGAVYFSDSTYVSSENKSCDFTNSKYFRLISKTNAANGWTGTIYWGTSSGSTSYAIADIDDGVITMRDSIEQVDYNGYSRTIYLTAVGQTTYKYRIHAMTTADGSYFSGGSQDYYMPSSSTWYTSNTVSNTFNLNNLPTPTRAYYKLAGWSYTNTSNATAHTGTVDVSATTDGKVNNFYAVWTLAPTIVLSANGGKFQDTQSTTKEYTKQTPGDAFYFTTPSGLVKRDGYKLLGWSASDTATTAGYDTDGWVTVGNSTVQRYYAVWQKTEVTITLQGNGGLWGGNLQYRTIKKDVGDTLSFADYGPNATPPLQRAYYTLAGWSANPNTSPDNPTYGINGYVTVGATDATYYAIWKHHIDPFYWDGNNGTTDSSIIAKGLPVTNLTAERWNRLKAKIKEISAAKGVTYTYSMVSSGQGITATEYNGVRNAIYNIPEHGALPDAKTIGSEILASLFNGTTSLKSALNAAIIAWNNS